MFESQDKLADEISRLLEVIRQLAGGRYACIIEPGATPFESGDLDETELLALRSLLEDQRTTLFALPGRMAAEEPMDDIFDTSGNDAFFMAFLNGRVGLVVVCPEAAGVAERVERPLRTLADRLLRHNPRYRIDRKGWGFLFGSPQLDIVAVERPDLGK